MRQVGIVLMAAALGLGACSGQSTPSLSAADNTFILQVSSSGTSEVALGQMAQRNSSNPMILRFAEKMVQDHAAVNQELSILAGRKGVTLPASPDPGRIDASRQLAQLTSTAFDQQYMMQQMQDHSRQLALFRQQAHSGADPDIKAFAQKYLPEVQIHAVEAQQGLDSVVGLRAPVARMRP